MLLEVLASKQILHFQAAEKLELRQGVRAKPLEGKHRETSCERAFFSIAIKRMFWSFSPRRTLEDR